jgi:hypothetical protein
LKVSGVFGRGTGSQGRAEGVVGRMSDRRRRMR